ncbi:MAG TPA: prolipoprotein diacylglyceryl transferase family protein [Myxococcaceae bacterium]|jgi:phosphatidylglycerol:prolipoprotein diacylglycerol transferase|nr:prolipoprotein diacylglyceryl transferase family protein [Myxococcaceae bacterium]
MIPYFRPPAIDLRILQIEPFGIMTAAGVLLGALLLSVAAKREGRDPAPLQDMLLWGLGGGVIGGHLVHIFLYHPEELARGPLQILRVWDGLSSMGGLLGGVAASLIFFRRHQLRVTDYSDALAMALAPAWGVARIGCFLVHDHPGVRTNFFLAVNFPPYVYPGGPRHCLGLDEALVLFSLAAILWTLHARGALKGRLLALLAVSYGTIRFFLDFLRARDLPYIDARYFGLTPAQYIVIAVVAWGVYALVRNSERTTQERRAAT